VDTVGGQRFSHTLTEAEKLFEEALEGTLRTKGKSCSGLMILSMSERVLKSQNSSKSYLFQEQENTTIFR